MNDDQANSGYGQYSDVITLKSATGSFELPERASAAKRNFLFLQGPIGPFFCNLAKQVSRSGARAYRINFNGGDRIFWNLPGAINYRGRLADWPEFLARRIDEWQITDLMLFGDCRPLHQAAIEQASNRGIAIHAFEEGYLRPNWITMELGGVNGHSSLPRNPKWFEEAAVQLEPWNGGSPVSSNFFRRAMEDVIYTFATVFLAWLYPRYRTHRPWHPLVEYRAGAKRFFLKARFRREAAKTVESLLSAGKPYYVFPLQLDSDSQIRFHSPFQRMAPAIETVIDSFLCHAPAESKLVLTEHPLDNGVIDLRAVTLSCAKKAGIEDRVIFLRNGSPEQLLRQSRGVIVINSTIGVLALDFGVPVITLGDPIYNIPGLTFQGELENFWHRGTPADPGFFDAFRRVVAAQTQINGGLYSRMARDMALDGICARLKLSEVCELPETSNVPSHLPVEMSIAEIA